MLICDGNKESLLELLGPRSGGHFQGLPRRKSIPTSLPRDSMLFVWEYEPTWDYLPDTIVTGDYPMEFLAWANTYLPFYKPFSAMCRVMDLRTALKVREWTPPTYSRSQQRAMAAVVYAEASLFQWNGSSDSKVTLPQCRATASYTLANAGQVGLPPLDFEEATVGWRDIRLDLRPSARPLPSRVISDVWLAINRLDDAFARPADFVSVWHRLGLDVRTSDGGRALFGSWETEASLGMLVSDREATREMKVEAFERLCARLVERGKIGTFEWALIGFAASRIAPGSLEHVDLVRVMPHELWPAALWIALFAGAQEPSDVLNAGFGLVRRLARDMFGEITRSPWVKPRCDISKDELDLYRSSALQDRLEQSHVGELIVELLPSVCAVLRWPGTNERRAEIDAAGRASEAERLIQEIRNLLRPLGGSSVGGADKRKRRGERPQL